MALTSKGVDGLVATGNELYDYYDSFPGSGRAIVVQKGSRNLLFDSNVIHGTSYGIDCHGKGGGDIAIEKTADPTMISAGDMVTYTYIVTNLRRDGPLSSVGVSDDKCTSVIFVGGDTDGDDLLDVGETWTYRCSMTLSEDTTNTATVTGTDSDGNPVIPDADTAFVDVRDSMLTILKGANDDSTVFEFTIRYGSNSESFHLKNGEWAQFPDLAPGSYTVAEAVFSRWELLSIACTNGISLPAPHTPAVTINLQSGQDVGCIFTNINKGLEEGWQIYLPVILKN